MYKIIKIGLILFMILSLQACSSLRMLNPFEDKVSFVEPPQDLSLSNSDYISIKQNQSDPTLTSNVKRSLSKANAGGDPYFKKVVVGDLSADLDLSRAAFIDISVEKSQVLDTRSQETRTQCPGNKVINTCSSQEASYYKVNCVTRKAELSVKLMVASAKDNTVLTTKNSTRTADSSLCSDESGSLESESSLLNKILASASSELIGDLIPLHKQRPSDLIDESESISEADAQTLLVATELAAKNNLVKAEGVYKDLSARYPQNASLLFNLAYINHALGNFEIASGFYSKTLQLTNDPEFSEDVAIYVQETQAWVNKGVIQVKR